MLEMRKSVKNLLVLGLIFVVVSLIPNNQIHGSGDVYPGEYTIFQFQCVDDPYIGFKVNHLLVPVTHGPINGSLYIITLEDAKRFVEGEPLENITKFLEISNENGYYGIVDLPAPGIYSALVTTSDSRGVHFSFNVNAPIPHLSILSIGIIIIGLGVFLNFYKRLIGSLKR
jgi:hypothetical protein